MSGAPFDLCPPPIQALKMYTSAVYMPSIHTKLLNGSSCPGPPQLRFLCSPSQAAAERLHPGLPAAAIRAQNSAGLRPTDFKTSYSHFVIRTFTTSHLSTSAIPIDEQYKSCWNPAALFSYSIICQFAGFRLISRTNPARIRLIFRYEIYTSDVVNIGPVGWPCKRCGSCI